MREAIFVIHSYTEMVLNRIMLLASFPLPEKEEEAATSVSPLAIGSGGA
jgi:hypothetical protein